MDALVRMVERVRDIRGAYQVGALAMIAAAVVVFASPAVSIGILLLGAVAFAYGTVSARGQTGGGPAINPAKGDLFAVADELPQDRPRNLALLDWIIFRHLKTDRPESGLGKTGQISARYFVDLREAALVPSQCDALAQALCEHIRKVVSVENHHGVVIPKSGNTTLGMAVARELGLAPIIVREWPFYGRWVETLIISGRGIIVDDVSTEGELLLEAAQHAREAGFVVTRAFLLIRRGEGAAEENLDKHRLSLSSVYTLTDEDLEELVGRVRRL
jgi:orotate phosphoribosyltransferase